MGTVRAQVAVDCGEEGLGAGGTLEDLQNSLGRKGLKAGGGQAGEKQGGELRVALLSGHWT